MIPVDAQLVAPPGYLLVERVEMAVRRGRIIVPEGIKMSTRSCEAIVVSVGEGVNRDWRLTIRAGSLDGIDLNNLGPGEVIRSNDPADFEHSPALRQPYREGDRVFLAAGVGRPIKLGVREERTVYRITDSMVLARIVADTEAGIESRGIPPQEIPAWEVEALSVIDEGEAEALK